MFTTRDEAAGTGELEFLSLGTCKPTSCYLDAIGWTSYGGGLKAFVSWS